jgi:hypothetical protein
MQRRAGDGARKDLMTWGDAAAAGPYAVVEIYRPADASDRFLDATSEIAARIVDYSVTDDVKPQGEIDSKIGTVPLIDFAIAPLGHERRCLGFARPFGAPALQIAGWYCSAGREVVDRALVAWHQELEGGVGPLGRGPGRPRRGRRPIYADKAGGVPEKAHKARGKRRQTRRRGAPRWRECRPEPNTRPPACRTP